MPIIEVLDLTKDYGSGRGVFDISIKVNSGECYGFLGPNGAGKTTAIRHLMGFSKPDGGSCRITDIDCWQNAAKLKSKIGYLPGEIAFPDSMTGSAFLKMMSQMRNTDCREHIEKLKEIFELDADIVIKSMSLGMKRKLAIVAAFMHDPEILILDEPTSGLDPIMQKKFIEFILSEKKRGKTIFLSSHIFHEVDAACDRIAIIKDGKIVSEFKADELKSNKSKVCRVTLANEKSYADFLSKPYTFAGTNPDKLRARTVVSDINKFISDISELDIADICEMPFTLENYFMHFYQGDKEFKEVR